MGDYMEHHHVSSLIPVTVYLVVRNIAWPRKYYSWLMSKLGIISLELYILQFVALMKDFHVQLNYLGGHRQKAGFGKRKHWGVQPWINFFISIFIFLVFCQATNDATGYFTKFLIRKDEPVLNKRMLISVAAVTASLLVGLAFVEGGVVEPEYQPEPEGGSESTLLLQDLLEVAAQ